MPRESRQSKQTRAQEVCMRMNKRYPEALCALHYDSPFTLTLAVLLSAQTTDVNVNKVTPQLFEEYATPEKMAAARLSDIETIVHPLGFYHSKARNCIALAQRVMTEYDGQIPCDIDELQTLPGVGRKTANIVMNEGFGKVCGIAVDTHVFRIAHRLGFSKADTPAATERDLLTLLPEELWGPVNRQWVLFGREVCSARKPACATCSIADLCPSCEA